MPKNSSAQYQPARKVRIAREDDNFVINLDLEMFDSEHKKITVDLSPRRNSRSFTMVHLALIAHQIKALAPGGIIEHENISFGVGIEDGPSLRLSRLIDAEHTEHLYADGMFITHGNRISLAMAHPEVSDAWRGKDRYLAEPEQVALLSGLLAHLRSKTPALDDIEFITPFQVHPTQSLLRARPKAQQAIPVTREVKAKSLKPGDIIWEAAEDDRSPQQLTVASVKEAMLNGAEFFEIAVVESEKVITRAATQRIHLIRRSSVAVRADQIEVGDVVLHALADGVSFEEETVSSIRQMHSPEWGQGVTLLFEGPSWTRQPRSLTLPVGKFINLVKKSKTPVARADDRLKIYQLLLSHGVSDASTLEAHISEVLGTSATE